MFGGLTHRPATELAKLLVENSPEGLTQVWLLADLLVLADLLGLGWGLAGARACVGSQPLEHMAGYIVFARHLVPRKGIPFETCRSVQP